MSNNRKSLYRRWRDYTWRGPSARWLATAAVLLILGLSAMVAAGLLGFNQGLQDRQAAALAQVEEHLANGVAQMEAGRTELAAAEFEMALQLDPNNARAREYLAALQASPVVTPTLAAPTVAAPLLVGPETTEPAPDTATDSFPTQALLNQAQAAMKAEDWTRASGLLEQLAAIDPDFRVEEVEEMRFEAAYQSGLALLDEESPEEALRAFDQALAIRPRDREAGAQRELAASYSNALGRWRVDWPSVIENLESIYEQQPDFLDVAERLPAAHEAWGDDLAKTGDWCQAAGRYAAVLLLSPSADMRTKKSQADEFCVTPPTPTVETAVVTTTVPADQAAGPAVTFNGSGHLAFATFSAEFNRWTVYRLAMQGNASPQAVAEAASQPDLTPAGDKIAARSESTAEGGLTQFSSNGANRQRLTTYTEDSHPSWSPDGGQFVFESNREGDRAWRIYHSFSGGTDTVLAYGRWPAWSRSNTVAYQGCDETGNRCGLWFMGVDGSNQRPITNVPGDAMPAWSPDGARLAFASAGRGGGWDIYVLEVASGNVASLSASPGIDAHPAWSPDGRQVAFLSNRDGFWAVYVVDVASGAVQPVLNVPGTLPDWYEFGLSWSR